MLRRPYPFCLLRRGEGFFLAFFSFGELVSSDSAPDFAKCLLLSSIGDNIKVTTKNRRVAPLRLDCIRGGLVTSNN